MNYELQEDLKAVKIHDGRYIVSVKATKMGMRLLTEKPGDVVRVEMYFPGPVTENSRVFGYDTLNGWQDFSGNSAVSSDGKRIILNMEDGGKGDADGCKNGVIVRTLGIGISR